MDTTFDLSDVDNRLEGERPPEDERLPELEGWVESQLADKPPLYYDIETGPRPWEEIERFYDGPAYKEPEPLPPWDESMVRYGNARKPETKKQRLAEHRAEYEAALENEDAFRAAHKAEWEANAAGDKTAWLEKAALSPLTGRVLLIGLFQVDFVPLAGPSEAANLGLFWSLVEDTLAAKVPVIGHNSNGFDLPFLVRRSWALDIEVPREIRQGRFWHPLVKDTMEVWACGAYGTRGSIKLDTLGQFLGLGGKTEGVHGKDFHKLWFGEMPAEQWGTPEEQRVKAIEYCGRDVELTAAIAAKMGMV